MSKAHRTRTLIDLAGMALALGTMFALQNFWLGIAAAILIFVITHALAENAFERLASREEIREDLEDRKNSE
jgi:high-affinity Fe2+/Pb2+ permease